MSSHGPRSSERYFNVVKSSFVGLRFQPPPLVLIGYETSEYPVQTQDMPAGVTVLQNWPHDAVMAAWQRCMVGLAPSVWNEPCATVPMEAMAVGKPVIATRIGGLTDIVADGETGVLVQPGSVSELVEALKRLLADADLRAQMGEKGRDRVRRFQASTVVPQYERLYEQLVNQTALSSASGKPGDVHGL